MGIVLSSFQLPATSAVWGWSLILCGLSILASLALRPPRPSIRWGAFLLTFFLLGGYRYKTDCVWPKKDSHWTSGPVCLKGIVADDPDYSFGQLLFRLTPEGQSDIGIRGRLRGKNPGISYGDFVEIKGVLMAPPDQRNPGGFDYRAFLRRIKVFFLLEVQGDTSIRILQKEHGHPLIGKVFIPLRRNIFCIFDKALQGEPLALLKGLIFGERSELSRETIEAFADTGTVHILAVSGFNVGLVAFIFFLFFRSLGLSAKIANFLLIPFLLLYVGLTDFTPSVVRATIMAVIFLIGFLLERETSLYNSLGLAALVILLLWPQALFDLSFSLSFTATFGIIYLAPRFYSLLPEPLRKSWLGLWLLLPFFVSLSAQLFSTPLIINNFYRLSLISPLANLVILPLVTLATALGFSQAFVGFLSLPLNQVFAGANWLVLKSILVLTAFFGHMPYASLRFDLPWLSVIGCYALLLSTPWVKKSRWSLLAIATSILLVLVPLGWRSLRSHDRTMTVTFLDVGQGDAELLEFPDGRTVLLDGGGANPGWNAGERDVAPFLWSQGRVRLDAIVASHLHQDHTGGLPFILDHFQVARFIESMAPCSTNAGAFLHRTVQVRNVPRFFLEAGDTLFFDPSVTVQAFLPSRGMVASMKNAQRIDPNFTSLVLKVSFRDVSFFFPGDIPSEADSALLVSGFDLSSTVLKVPHHGSSKANSLDFVGAVHPQLAIISLSEKNCQDLSQSPVLDLYRHACAHILQTAEQGAIAVKTDGRKLWFRTQIQPKWQELTKP